MPAKKPKSRPARSAHPVRKINPDTSFTPEQIAAADAARDAAQSATPEEVLRSFLPSTNAPLPPPAALADMIIAEGGDAGQLAIRHIPFSVFLVLQAAHSPLVDGGSIGPAEIPRAVFLVLLCRAQLELAADLAHHPVTLDRAAWLFADRVAAADMVRLGLEMQSALRGEFSAAVPTAKPSKEGEVSAPLERAETAPS
jgi:hypothetical protein